jgi:hypothetical protein
MNGSHPLGIQEIWNNPFRFFRCGCHALLTDRFLCNFVHGFEGYVVNKLKRCGGIVTVGATLTEDASINALSGAVNSGFHRWGESRYLGLLCLYCSTEQGVAVVRCSGDRPSGGGLQLEPGLDRQ